MHKSNLLIMHTAMCGWALENWDWRKRNPLSLSLSLLHSHHFRLKSWRQARNYYIDLELYVLIHLCLTVNSLYSYCDKEKKNAKYVRALHDWRTMSRTNQIPAKELKMMEKHKEGILTNQLPVAQCNGRTKYAWTNFLCFFFPPYSSAFRAHVYLFSESLYNWN